SGTYAPMLLRLIPRPTSIIIPFLILSLISSGLIYHAIYELQLRVESSLSRDATIPAKAEEIPSPASSERKRIAWIGGHGKNIETTYMKHIFEAFRNYGYEIVSGCERVTERWDVIWLHEYALSKNSGSCYYEAVQNAHWPQAVNHVPGSGYYSSKVHLATAKLSAGVPLAFKLPAQADQFKEYAATHPELLWVHKDNTHRNIRIKSVQDIDVTKTNSFVQKFVDNPLLIDNRKFDIGIYTVVTSLNPLRVYVYDDVLIRFCPKDYHPFDAEDVDKYVVGDDYTPIWEIPSLMKLYNDDRYSMRETISEHLSKGGKDANKIWKQLNKIITEVFQSQQAQMAGSRPSRETDPKFFELSRFDFVVDDELNVFLMEANMSPNLSSGHFKPNQLIYEQVLMSVLSLVGLANPLSETAVEEFGSRRRSEFPPVSDRDLALAFPFCDQCGDCGSEERCALCGACLAADAQLSDALAELLREEHERRKMRRLRIEWGEGREPFSRLDRLQALWIEKKCERDSAWC
ncbi:ttll-15, partial [Pristionchus pacificus]